jgi:hypothetical protein
MEAGGWESTPRQKVEMKTTDMILREFLERSPTRENSWT